MDRWPARWRVGDDALWERREVVQVFAGVVGKPAELNKDAPDYWTKLATSAGYSITTVQKAEQILVARGWLVRIRTGKNWLTRAERRELHAAGSAARQRRNVWACTVPKLAQPASTAAVLVDNVVDRLVDNIVAAVP